MNKTTILPLCVILLQLSAGVVYAFNKDWRKMTLWVAVAVANIVVTF